ncbi:hypothetical protein D9M69_622880 [compost metagenome]
MAHEQQAGNGHQRQQDELRRPIHSGRSRPEKLAPYPQRGCQRQTEQGDVDRVRPEAGVAEHQPVDHCNGCQQHGHAEIPAEQEQLQHALLAQVAVAVHDQLTRKRDPRVLDPHPVGHRAVHAGFQRKHRIAVG